MKETLKDLLFSLPALFFGLIFHKLFADQDQPYKASK